MNKNKVDSILEKKSSREFDLGTHISLKNRYVYFQVSKAASSTVKHYLQSLETLDTGRSITNVNNRNLSPHIWPSQLSKEDLSGILADASFKKLTFVRNPYTRILSCYLHRIRVDVKSTSNRALANATGGRSGTDVEFGEFVDIICDQESPEQESHWRCQYDEISYPIIENWAHIGKFENLNTDLQEFLSQYTDQVSVRPKISKSPAVTSAGDKLKEFYTPKLQAKIVDRFALDFETFGYSRELEGASE